MSDIEMMEPEAVSEVLIDDLRKANEALMEENVDLKTQNELLVKQHIGLEDRFNKEKLKWREERQKMAEARDELSGMVSYLSEQLEAAQGLRKAEKQRRVESTPKLVLIAAAALALLAVPYTLQELGIIGAQIGGGIQCVIMMAISWCYALIWDRTRK